jgi:hypothetical protein
LNELRLVREVVPRRTWKHGLFPTTGLRFGLLLGAVVALGTSARAAPVEFKGLDLNQSGNSNMRVVPHPNSDLARANFLANLTGGATEDFEGFAGGTTLPITLAPVGAPNATLSGSGQIVDLPLLFPTDGNGRYPISGTKYVDTVATPQASQTYLTIDFSAPTAALGFYGVDFGDFQGQASLVLTSTVGTTTLNIPHDSNSVGANGSVLYYGVIDTMNPFTRAEFIITTGTDLDAFALDGLTWAGPSDVAPPNPTPVVPAPPGVVLAGIGAISLLGYRWRRRGTVGS